VVANQDIAIKDIERQAKHLDLSCVGIPMHRSSGVDYVDRIREGTTFIERNVSDVPLTHWYLETFIWSIFDHGERRDWGSWETKTEFPSMACLHTKDLRLDLQQSQVPCVVSASISGQRSQSGTIVYTVDSGTATEAIGEIRCIRRKRRIPLASSGLGGRERDCSRIVAARGNEKGTRSLETTLQLLASVGVILEERNQRKKGADDLARVWFDDVNKKRDRSWHRFGREEGP
jgi:hypothetical protein